MKNPSQNNYMYYFDKRAVLMDHEKFDQVFDDQYSNNNSQNFNNKQVSNSQNNFYNKSTNNKNPNTNSEMMYTSHNHNLNKSNVSMSMNNNSMRESHNNNQNIENSNYNTNGFNQSVNNQTKTIFVNFTKNEIYETIKSMFLKTKGYIELRDKQLLDYFKEFRSFEKKGIKVPDKIAPLLQLSNNIIEKALVEEYNLYLANRLKDQHKLDYAQKKKKTHPNPKFTDNTLKEFIQNL